MPYRNIKTIKYNKFLKLNIISFEIIYTQHISAYNIYYNKNLLKVSSM